jgi:hypothetical protein
MADSDSALAESVTERSQAWCVQRSVTQDAGRMTAVFESLQALDHASLIWTAESAESPDRQWIESPASLRQDGATYTVSVRLPETATACIFNVKSGDLIASFYYQESADYTSQAASRPEVESPKMTQPSAAGAPKAMFEGGTFGCWRYSDI